MAGQMSVELGETKRQMRLSCDAGVQFLERVP
jgi:hypothetical protein